MKYLLLLAVVLAMATTAFGAPCASYTATPSLPNTVVCGDKTFDFTTIGPFFGGEPTFTVSESSPTVFIVGISNINGLKTSFDFNYTVTAPVSSPITSFNTGVLLGTGGSIKTTLTPGGVLTAIGPNAGASATFSPGVTTLGVVNHYTGSLGSYAIFAGNTITESPLVPEPLTLGLTGLGLAAMGFMARRKFAR